MNLQTLYQRSPLAIKKIFRLLVGQMPTNWRFNRHYWEAYNQLKISEWWDEDRLKDFQWRKLKKLIDHAYKNVPYYRRLFEEGGLRPEAIKDFSDFKKIPFLTKKILQDNLQDLIALNYHPSKLKYITTGGSTGFPVGFYLEKNVSQQIEWAYIMTLWRRVGFFPGQRYAILRGQVVSYSNAGRFWEYDALNHTLILSSTHMTEDRLAEYIKKIQAFKPKYIHAFPSSLVILAKFIKLNKYPSFPFLKALLCASENLYDWQRALFKEVFGCRVFSHYGQTEQVALAGECEVSQDYHVFPEFGYVEFLDEKNQITENVLETPAEIVGTGLNNYICPLIRYRTGDLAYTSKEKCLCGRRYPIIKKIEGRLQDFLYSSTGRPISIASTNMHSEVYNQIHQFQFHQEKYGEVDFIIVKKASYGPSDEIQIARELGNVLGDDVKINLKYVSEIPPTIRGKHRLLIQKLPSGIDNN